MTRDVGLTSWWHQCNIMPVSIFHETMRQGTTYSVSFFVYFSFLFSSFFFCFFFVVVALCGVIHLFSSGWKRWNQFYHFNRLRSMGLISLWSEVWNMSGDFRLTIPLWGPFAFVWWVVFNQGCCVFIQCNLLKGCFE